MTAHPHDTPEHLAYVALDLFGGNVMLAIERLDQASRVLKHWKRTAIWTGDVIPDNPTGSDEVAK